MTLILSFVALPIAVQVSDRLLTQEVFRGHQTSGAQFVTFDAISNKSVVYRARDAVVAIAYSGPAYIRDTPTDQFVVEALVGESLTAWLDEPVMRFGATKEWLDISWAIRRLCERFDNAANGERFELSLVGWQWKKSPRRARPIAWTLSNGSGDDPMRAGSPRPRHWYLPRRRADGRTDHPFYLGASGYPMPEGKLDELRNAMSSGLTQRDAMYLMADSVKSVAASGAPVGEDSLVISIPHPSYEQIDIFFASPKGRVLELLRGGVVMESCELGFSPWIVSGHLIAAPALHVGCWRHAFTPYSIEVHAPDPPDGNHIRRAILQQVRPTLRGRRPGLAYDVEELPPLPDPETK